MSKVYFNKNSQWYLINGNYKGLEEIQEECIDLTQYEMVNLESSECNINYGFDDFNGVAKCYTWEADDGKCFLEEEGSFKEFESREELEHFMNLKEVDLQMIEKNCHNCNCCEEKEGCVYCYAKNEFVYDTNASECEFWTDVNDIDNDSDDEEEY